ncbi:PAS domain S-box protein [Thermodesulfobacteriota bacterium]
MKPHNNSKQIRILLVEDSEHDFIAFRRTLRKSRIPIEITHYVRAEDALERLMMDSSGFDLVVTDYKLPGMSGLEFCKTLLGGYLSLPVVILIGTGSNGLGVEALKAGVDDYLIKDPNQGYLEHLPIILVDAVRKHSDRLASKQPDDDFVYSDTLYPVIIEDQTELIRCFSPSGSLTFVNNAYCSAFNKNREDLIGRHFMQFIPDEDQKILEKHIASLNKEDSIKTIDCRVIGPDGRIHLQEWTDRAIFNGEGDLIGFQSIGRDISDKRQMEEVIQQGNDRYHSLIEITPNGFFICDLNSGDFILINQKACDIFGYAMPDLLTHSLWNMINADEKERLQETIQTQKQEGIIKFPRVVCTFLRKGVTTFKGELFSSLIIFDGNLVLQGIIRGFPD